MRFLPAILIAPILLALLGLAHEDEATAPDGTTPDSLHIRGYDITFSRPPDTLAANRDATLTVVVKDPGSAPAAGLNVQGQILDATVGKEIFFAAATEGPPGTYGFSWKPSFAGDYLVQFIFHTKDDEVLQPTFPIRVDDPRATYAWVGGLLVAAIAVALGALTARPKADRKFRVVPLLVGVAIGAGAVGLAYSLGVYYQGGGERGFVVCTAQGCDLAVHWHSELEMSACGKPYHLPLERGDLNRQHTHKEQDRLHFHAVIKTNEAGSELLEPEKLRLGELFDQLKLRFTKTCFLEHCTGDPCPDGRPGALTVTVNGVPNPDLSDYVWKDGDTIRIAFEP